MVYPPLVTGKKRTRRSEHVPRRPVDVVIEHAEIAVTSRSGNARSDRERKPSDVTDRFWLETERKRGNYPEPTERSGKWLIYVAPRNVDAVWRKIRDAVEAGKLGGRAKVSTALRDGLGMGKSSGARVICVYTYDWTDEADVRRVRRTLRRLSIVGRIPYKADEDTLAGKYKASGDRNLSRYVE